MFMTNELHGNRIVELMDTLCVLDEDSNTVLVICEDLANGNIIQCTNHDLTAVEDVPDQW